MRLQAPAEWERHEATWLVWPHNRGTFPDPILPRVEEDFAEMAAEISRGELVKILVRDPETADRADKMLAEHGARGSRTELVELVSADVWIRDYGPFFVREGSGGLAGVKWRFNAWGGKYSDLAFDDETGRRVLELSRATPILRSLVVEGGALEISGDGLAMATEQCLLHPSRNLGLDKRTLEAELEKYLGVRRVLWLRRGVVGDDTDGHIDVFCRFAPGGRILLAEDRVGPNREILEEAAETLEAEIESLGLVLEIVRVPMPPAAVVLGAPVPASYLNFYVSNSAVILPVFGAREDEEALAVLSECYGDRRVVALRCPELFYGLGGPHCVTLQQPARPHQS
jgi:agmatine deiminase